MEIRTHLLDTTKIAEIRSKDVIVNNAIEGIDLLGSLYYDAFDAIILYESNMTSAFFDLKNGMAGEILQKFSNYRMRLAIVGDFSKYQSNSLQDFIRESNRSKHIQFVDSLAKALAHFSEQ